MQILLLPKSIDVTTIPPDAKRNPETKAPEGEIHRRILLPEHFPAINSIDGSQSKSWLEDSFDFYLDDNLVAQYLDETAAPGTVRFETLSEMLVHLDDVAITGPRIRTLEGS